MKNSFWALIYYYGSVAAFIIVFLFLSDKKRFKEFIPLGLLIAVENYTLEIILLHLGFYVYPLSFPGYPDILIVSSVILFPIIGILYYQFLTRKLIKNFLLTLLFLSINMISEALGLYIGLFSYRKSLNLFIVFLIYFFIYLLINFYRYILIKRRRSFGC